MPIGLGKLRDGLYYFELVSSLDSFFGAAVVSAKIWHSRLGHPSPYSVSIPSIGTFDEVRRFGSLFLLVLPEPPNHLNC
ncbi:hypothetical protein NE237_031690 [Protea cynaroides]|uniref:Uncharacterized protein n=1 Tax=Protea cynaroides TaxID=273540 RepID=A0A9Q0L1R5_9MAGN|nr:hypothetical protein NE237_031690 [Protea cynaroides]